MADLEMVDKNIAYKWSRLHYLWGSFELYFGVQNEIVQIAMPFSTYACHVMGNNLMEGFFKIIFRNIIFHFLSAKMTYFVKHVHKIWFKMTPIYFSQRVVHM